MLEVLQSMYVSTARGTVCWNTLQIFKYLKKSCKIDQNKDLRFVAKCLISLREELIL